VKSSVSENQSGVWPFNLLRRPIYKDWIFWLWLLSLLAASPLANSLTDDRSQEINLVAGAIDFLIAFVIQTLIFLVLPAKLLRRSKQGLSTKRLASEYEVGLSREDREFLDNLELDYEFELTDELREFLDSLDIGEERQDGWYKDPSGLFKLRYFYRSKWTLETSDSDSESDKSVALSKFLTVTKKAPIQQNASISSPDFPQEEIVLTQVVKQSEPGNIASNLEKLAALLDRGLLSNEEFQKAKNRLLDGWSEDK
jgi:hypothetical protein